MTLLQPCKRASICVGGLMLIAAHACYGQKPPADEVALTIINQVISKRSVVMGSPSWCGHVLVGGLDTLEITARGHFNSERRYWPIRVKAQGFCQADIITPPRRFTGTGGFALFQNDFGEWIAKDLGTPDLTFSAMSSPAVPQPPILRSAPRPTQGPSNALQPTIDPAIAFAERQPLFPGDKRILTSGFGGFRVGQSIGEAELFFGFTLEAPIGPAGTAKARNCGQLRRINHEKPAMFLMTRHDKVMAFTLYDDSFKTSSGVAVGDTEEKVVSVYGKVPTFKKNTPLGTQEGASFYYSLFSDQPLSIRLTIHDRKVAAIKWGSTWELEGDNHLRCT